MEDRATREARANILAEDRRLEQLRQWSYLLDQAFRVPGTNFRFGWDPIISLIPGLGDLSSPVFAGFVLVQAYRMRVPRVVQARMLINALVDALIGLVPVLGNLADSVWKANTWNMQLLERHARPATRHTRGDLLFVWGVLGLLALTALTPLVLLIWFVVWAIGHPV